MTRKILVVDDTRNMQAMLRDFLETQDFTVVAASDRSEEHTSELQSQY